MSVAVLALSAATLATALGRRLQSATYLAAGDVSVAPLLAPPSAAALVCAPARLALLRRTAPTWS